MSVRCCHNTINHIMPMLDYAFVQRLIFLFPLLKLLFIVKHHFFLLSQDLLYHLVLVLTKFINSLVRLNFKLYVFVTNNLQVLEVLID